MKEQSFVSVGVGTSNMAGKQVAGTGLSESIAGMSKNQLHDIMSQMKVLSNCLAIGINICPSPFSSDYSIRALSPSNVWILRND